MWSNFDVTNSQWQFATAELCSTPAKHLLQKQPCDNKIRIAIAGSMNRAEVITVLLRQFVDILIVLTLPVWYPMYLKSAWTRVVLPSALDSYELVHTLAWQRESSLSVSVPCDMPYEHAVAYWLFCKTRYRVYYLDTKNISKKFASAILRLRISTCM